MAIREYGRNITIHSSEHVDVETDAMGNVVSVWFRCQIIPFKQTRVSRDRQKDMAEIYASKHVPKLLSITIMDRED